MILNYIQKNITKKKLLALLIDPDKHTQKSLITTLKAAGQSGVDFIFIGGSLVGCHFQDMVKTVKEKTKLPVILFPGSLLQLSDHADGLLLLSFISGRNPELLIGNHVVAAPLLKTLKAEIIPTGYMLIESGRLTSAEYMSQTKPIPRDKTDIACATAVAGELLGLKMIYMDAGSGADRHISTDMIREVKKNIRIPLIIGGGIRTPAQAKEICKAGADMVVIGTAVEKEINALRGFAIAMHGK